MVTKRKQHSSRRPVKQGPGARAPRPNKIGAATPYHFRGKNLTPYGGLLPVATLLEKLGFQALLEETLTTKRITRAMSPYQFVLALVLGLYVGFARLNQTPLHRSRPHPDRHLASDASAAAVHAVALSGLAAPQRGEADPFHSAPAAGTSLGRGPREVGDGDAGHRHHRAYPLRPPDGRAQELQPQEQGQAQATSRY